MVESYESPYKLVKHFPASNTQFKRGFIGVGPQNVTPNSIVGKDTLNHPTPRILEKKEEKVEPMK